VTYSLFSKIQLTNFASQLTISLPVKI